MKRLVLAVLAMTMLTLLGWGELTPKQQAREGAATHRREARDNQARPRHRRKHHHHHHHQNGV
jgi:Ni/Co efflux regulator RcnB